MPTAATAHDHATTADSGRHRISSEPESARPFESLSSAESDVEEGRGSYKPGRFHPVYIGDIYAEKYEVLSKIGYGVYSTVWLVRGLTKP